MRRASSIREPGRRSAAELDPPSRAAALPDHRPQAAALSQLVQAAANRPVAQLGKQSKRTGGTQADAKAADKERRKQQEAIRAQGQKQSQAAKDSTRDTGAMAIKADKSQKEAERKAREAREDKTANDQAINAAYQQVVAARANPPPGVAPGTINCGDNGIPGGTNSPIRLACRNGAQAMNVASNLQASRSGVLSRHYAHANGTIIVHIT